MDRIAENFVKHFTLLPSKLEGMSVFQNLGLIYADSGLPCDTFNVAFVNDPDQLSNQSLTDLVEHFKSKKFPFCVWADDVSKANHKLKLAGFEIAAEDITMQLDISDLADIVVANSGKVTQVKTPEQLQQCANVIARNWDPLDKNVLDFYQTVGDQLDFEELGTYFFNLNYDNQIIGCIELCPTDHNTAGIYGLAVQEAYRRQGFGHQLMTHALKFAAHLNFKHIILQASEDGLGLYKRMGFKEVGKFQEWQLV